MKIYQENFGDINPINAKNEHSSRSEKYTFVDSQEIKTLIESNGFIHNTTSFAEVRKEHKAGFQKHIMIFDHESFKIDDENRLQLLVTNSHDGSSSLRFNLGVFRTVCANGLVVGSSFDEIRIRHLKVNKILIEETLEKFAAKSEHFIKMVRSMQNTQLNYKQIEKLAISAQELRLRHIKIHSVQYASVVDIKREADKSTDLWTVFNVVQESMIKGGIKYIYDSKVKNGIGKLIEVRKSNTTKEIKNFKEVEFLNKNLWDIAEKIAA